ncbi:MAG: helix-turn-helix domain-containing protein, partial [Byssovorax sp.]
RFREDLYYRARVVEIELPPLRARGPEEIESLARHFADVYATRYGRPTPRFEPAALVAIRAHAWPGNVRELEHWIESAIALAPDGRVTASHLPRRGADPGVDSARREGVTTAELRPIVAEVRGVADAASRAPERAPERDAASPESVSIPLGLPLEEAVRRYVDATVKDCDGNKTEAAKSLGVGRNTIGRALRR